MDFSFSEEQEAVRELADRIFTDLSTQERLREMEIEPDGDRFDRKLWSELAAAGLLGIALPEDVGGAGLGFLETGLLAEAAGRTAAYVPGGRDPGRRRPGHRPLRHRRPAAALAARRRVRRHRADHRPGGAGRLDRRRRRRWPSRSGDGWALTGVKACVPSGTVADAVLVTARIEPDAVAVFIVPTAVRRARRRAPDGQQRPARGPAHPRPGSRSGPTPCSARSPTARPIVEWLVQRSTAALALVQAGAAAASVALVAEYTKTREQFGKPIATFQAVGQRAADAYVDAEAIRLTAWQAAWRLAEGLPADKEIAVAKFWAADGGQRVVHAAVHLHGGVGVDREYPLHRFFLNTKHIELTLGGATDQLLRLGATLAAEPA